MTADHLVVLRKAVVVDSAEDPQVVAWAPEAEVAAAVDLRDLAVEDVN